MNILLILGALCVLLVLYFVRRQYTYWQRRNFPYDAASTGIPFGCLTKVAKNEQSMGMAIYDVYKRCKERYVGVYLLYRPGLLVRDANLARKVLAEDFSSFHDRGVYVDEEKDPLSANLFSLRGQSWRTMRTKLAPSFSSGKLKNMFGTSEDIGNKMVDHLNTLIPEGVQPVEVDIMEVLTTYAVDIIGSVIFGLEINSFEKPNNDFRTLVTKARSKSLLTAVIGMLIFLCPGVVKIFFKLGIKNPIVIGLRRIIGDTIDFREKHNVVRRDMLQMLMQLRSTGKINLDDDNWAVQTPAEKLIAMSLDTITAHSFVFYSAGQGTTAATAAYTLFELAQYPELLRRAESDVLETLARHGGKLNYESLQAMEFLELCMLETLRKYPGLPLLNRECTEDYQIPGTDDIVEKGTPIVISLIGIHRDAKYFPNPETYDPDRFAGNRRDYEESAYMPFGDGPRHCIAQRMGKINSKLAIAKILQNFNIEITTKREIEPDTQSLAIVPKDGIKLRLTRKPEKGF